MEWIHTTGKTVEEAKDRALHELGIDEEELEFEVVQEPKSRFLGLGSQDAQIRARVKPISRAKPERRNRRQRGRERGRDRGGRGGPGRGKGGNGRSKRRDGGDRGDRGDRDDRGPRGDRGDAKKAGESGPRDEERTPSRRGGKGRGKGGGGRPAEKAPRDRQRDQSEERTMSDVPIEEQAEVAADFVRGLLDEFGMQGETSSHVEDERVHVEVEGDDLGLLIGPGGGTMEAVQELVKTTLQRHTQGQNARVAVDIGGYGAKRRTALEDFARRLGQAALDTGKTQVLEPMNAPDRKVVHDAINEMDGVTTTSEGEEPRRRVVITPE